MTIWEQYMEEALSEKSTGSKKSKSYRNSISQLKDLKKEILSIEKAVQDRKPSLAADRTIGLIQSAKFLGKTLKIFFIEWEDDERDAPDTRPHTGEQADQAEWEEEWEKKYGKEFNK